MAQRLAVLTKQVAAPTAVAQEQAVSWTACAAAPSPAAADDDVVICSAVRTALTRAKKGPLANAKPEDMLTVVLKESVARAKCDAKKVGDVVVGNVLQPGAGVLGARQACLMAGIPDSVSCVSVNRQCSSGLQAVANVAGAIKAGFMDIGIGAGVESMTHYDMMSSIDPSKVSENVFEHDGAASCLMPMGITSENVAAKFNISREVQDALAASSHAKAAAAQKAGHFKEEIVAMTVQATDKDGNTKSVVVDADDGIRAGTTAESLGTLKAAFQKGGSTTAGNASQVTDGAAAVLMARRSVAKAMGMPILARVRSFAVAGCPPEIMGIGPAVAIPEALKQAKLDVKDIDIFEINEAFASQATYCVQHLGVPQDRLNPKGGAIALGHPLGATGARQIATLLPELRRQGKKLGCVSMCIGTGMGAAGVFELE